jgi:hypothetical protein
MYARRNAIYDTHQITFSQKIILHRQYIARDAYQAMWFHFIRFTNSTSLLVSFFTSRNILLSVFFVRSLSTKYHKLKKKSGNKNWVKYYFLIQSSNKKIKHISCEHRSRNACNWYLTALLSCRRSCRVARRRRKSRLSLLKRSGSHPKSHAYRLNLWIRVFF